MDELLKVLNGFLEDEYISENDREIFENLKKFINLDILFWNIIKDKTFKDSSKILELGKTTNQYKNKLNDFFCLIGLSNNETVFDKAYQFIWYKINEYSVNEVPKNVFDIFLKENNKIKIESKSKKALNSIINYNLFKNIYINNSYEGLAKFKLLNRNIEKLTGFNILVLLSKNNSITSDTILNLTSEESVLNDFSYSNQALILSKLQNEELNDVNILKYLNLSKSKEKKYTILL